MRNVKITENEIKDFVDDYNNGMSAKDIAKKYNLSEDSIRKYLKKSGVFKSKTHNWSNELDEKLKEVYPTGDWGLIFSTFPNRSRSFLYTRASQLGLHNQTYFWSEHDKMILKEYYYVIPTEEIQKMLDKEYSIRLIQNQAKKNGVDYKSILV